MNLPLPPAPTNANERPNASFGWGSSDNLTDAEIAANEAERTRWDRLEDLEQTVVNAAIGLITMNKPNTPAHAYIHAHNDLKAAVDALLAEREGK